MFAKDKINLNMAVEKTDLRPGELLIGSLSVSVSDEVECTAIRVKVHGKARTSVTVRRQKSTVTYTEDVWECVHYITCLGFTKQSERKGGCFITPGATYSYAFQYQIPFDAPGTAERKQGDAKIAVTWTVTGYVDIHHGFDKEKIVDLFVYTPAPAMQVRANPAPLPETLQAVARCGCTGCYCCATGEHISVTPTVSPAVVLIGYSDSQQGGQVRVDVEVISESASIELKDARVTINQVVTATARGYTRAGTKELGRVILNRAPDYGLAAQKMSSTASYARYSGMVPLEGKSMVPSMVGTKFSIIHAVVIDFPHTKVMEGVYNTALCVANVEDELNLVAPQPRVYPEYNNKTEVQL